jgi:hypothetical protein
MDKLIEAIKTQGFILGGSRKMAEKYPDKIKVHEATDWDFYCPDTPENRGWLNANGFDVIAAKNRNYWDSLLTDIYKHRERPIEVLVRKNVPLYQFCFDSIAAETFRYRLWKSCPEVPLENVQAFRASVCAYFCALFNTYAGQFPIESEEGAIELDDEIPF